MSQHRQAATIEQIYAVENGVEDNIVDLLVTTAGLDPATVLSAHEGFFAERDTLIHVMATIQGSNGRLKTYRNGLYESGWTVGIQVRVVTPLVTDQGEAAELRKQHGLLVGKVRAAMQYGRSLGDRRYSGIHAVVIRQEGAATREIDSDANENITALTWDAQVEVRSDAWP